jgi:hypothetical protein
MVDPLWHETLPDEFFNWYESIKAKSTDIISLTIRVKRANISIDYLDLNGKPKRTRFYIDPARRLTTN